MIVHPPVCPKLAEGNGIAVTSLDNQLNLGPQAVAPITAAAKQTRSTSKPRTSAALRGLGTLSMAGGLPNGSGVATMLTTTALPNPGSDTIPRQATRALHGP